MDDVIDDAIEGILVVDRDWRVSEANATAEDVLDTDVSGLAGANVAEVFPRSATSTFHEHVGPDATPEAVSFEEYYPELERWLDVRMVPTDGGVRVYLRDVTRRKDLERELDERNAELSRLSRINGIIQEIIRELIGATKRAEIEEIVCTRLASADLYEYVWIGERDTMSDRLSARIAAGEYNGVVDFGIERNPDEGPESPEQTALRTGETQLVRQLTDDSAVPEQMRREAFAHGLQSSIAVPFQYGSTTYGVLGVYATHPNAFSDRERESLETLGETVGFVINATRQRNLLLSDTVIELTFDVSDPDAFFVSTSARFDCELSVEGIIPLSEGELIGFVQSDGAEPRAVLEMADESAGVEPGRVIYTTSTEGETGGLVEIRITDGSALLALVEYGATIAAAEFDCETGRIVTEVAPGADVREIVEAVRAAHPRSELVAKRERHRQVETVQEFRSSLHDRLTDRQRTVLRTAFHGGYFESPRDSTAEELAESLDISGPTFHNHLRAAEWKLLDAFFEGDSEHERLGPTERGTGSGETG